MSKESPSLFESRNRSLLSLQWHSLIPHNIRSVGAGVRPATTLHYQSLFISKYTRLKYLSTIVSNERPHGSPLPSIAQACFPVTMSKSNQTSPRDRKKAKQQNNAAKETPKPKQTPHSRPPKVPSARSCQCCKNVYSTKAEYDIHIFWCMSGGRCPACPGSDYEYDKAEYLRDHFDLAHKRQGCRLCSATFNPGVDKDKHFKACHPEIDPLEEDRGFREKQEQMRAEEEKAKVQQRKRRAAAEEKQWMQEQAWREEREQQKAAQAEKRRQKKARQAK